MLISQVGREGLLKLQAGIAEMALNGAFGTSDFCCDGFDGQFVVVVEQKDASADGGECRQGLSEGALGVLRVPRHDSDTGRSR